MLKKRRLARLLANNFGTVDEGLAFGVRLQSSLVPYRAAGSPTPTFTRATTAYVLGYAAGAVIADGPTLIACASGEARFMGARRVSEGVWSAVDANGVTLTTTNGASALCCDAYGPYGYNAEGARTNRCLYSQVFSNAAWVSGGGGIAVTDNSAVAPDGTTTADTLAASGANGTLIQDLGVVASASKTGGLWLKRKTGTGNIDITMDGGTGWTTVAVTSTWTRFQKNQTLADEDFGIRIVTSGDEVYAWQGQVETAAFLSSDIPTTTAAVTRNTDDLEYVVAGNVNEAAGTIYAEVAAMSIATGEMAAGGVDSNRQWLRLTSATGMSVYDGTNNNSKTGLTAITNNEFRKMAVAFSGSTMSFTGSGAAPTSAAYNGDIAAANTNFVIGGYAGTKAHFGNVRNVRIYNRALSDARLTAMTT